MEKKQPISSSSYILKRFSLYFLIFSILPLFFLAYLYFQYEAETTITISKENTRWIIILISMGTILSFFVIRKALYRIHLLSENLKKQLFEKIDREIIMDFARDDGEVGDLAKVFGDILSKLQKNIEDLQETKKTLHEVLSKVGKALTSVESFDSLIQLILETTMDALSTKKGAIVYLKEDKDSELKAYMGFTGLSKKEILDAVSNYINFAINEKKPLFIPSTIKGYEYERETLFSPPLVCMPLIFRDKVWGAIALSGKKKDINFSEDETKILANLSSQIAISFENAKLNNDIEKTYFETMAALALAVEAKDYYSRGHSEKVERYAIKIAEELNIPKEDVQTLRYAARLHDVGKIGIADNILNKEGKLLPEEREIMKKHPEVGESIVKPLKNFQHLLEPIRHHHELLDGSGYPDGLKGDDISTITRILTISDIFEAITSDRPYRKALPMEQAKEILQDFANNGRIDKKIVSILFKLIDENGL
ncbi:MAG: HD domain-containing phosphohydrolase [Candidatus Omnitrophota bacterium]